MLNFELLTLEKKELIDSYTLKYGHKSCQYSFVSNFCHKQKYDDHFCIINDFLVFYRKGISKDGKRIFLFPSGDFSRKDELKETIQLLEKDCAENNCQCVFDSITKSCADILDELFPGKYEITENRDYFEYIYDASRLSGLAESCHKRKRQVIKHFLRENEGHVEISQIKEKDFEDIRAYEKAWVEENYESNLDNPLIFEQSAIDVALDNYNALKLFGIVVRIDGKLAGFTFGGELSENTYDCMFLKADKDYKGLSSLLYAQALKYFDHHFDYANMEEDLGIEGLRRMKLSYYPDMLLEKFSVCKLNVQ